MTANTSPENWAANTHAAAAASAGTDSSTRTIPRMIGTAAIASGAVRRRSTKSGATEPIGSDWCFPIQGPTRRSIPSPSSDDAVR